MALMLDDEARLMERRPVSRPPEDGAHQWFTAWQAADAPEVLRWIAHFTRERIGFTQTFREGCPMPCWRPHDHVYRWTMLYVHHLLAPRNAKAATRWCCRR